MSDKIHTLRGGRFITDENRPDTATKDVEDLVASIREGEISVAYGVLVYVDKKGDFSYHRVGTPSLVEAHGLLHMGHMQIDKAHGE